MSLARPPKRQAAGPLALVGRVLLVVLLLVILGSLGWAITVNGSVEEAETLGRDFVVPGTMVVIPGLTEIHLREEGAGEPVLLIHDFDLAGGYQWSGTVGLLGDRRLLMPDLIDFGFSPRPGERSRIHTIVGQAETLLAMLDEIGITHLSVVGAGMGGAVAAQMASLDPGVIDRLILISPEILGPEPSWDSLLYRLPTIGDAMIFTFMGAGGRADSSYSAGCQTGGYCPDAGTREVRRTASAIPGTTEALAALLTTPPASTLPASLGLITAPTLIVWGGDDALTPLSQAEELAATIAGSSLEIVSGAGHRPHLEDPEATAAAIVAFLDSQ